MTRSRVLPLIARLPLVAVGLAGAASLGACSGSNATAGGPINLPPINTAAPSASQAGSAGGVTDAPSSDAASDIPSSSAPSPSPSPSASASMSPSAASDGRCATSQLTVTLGGGGGAAGSTIFPLTFSNSSSTTCTLSGFPGVSFVTGSTGTQVGEPAGRNGATHGVQTLKPGGTTVALFQQSNPEDYPPDTCKAVTVLGLRVYPPDQTAAAFVPLPAGSTACSTTSQNGGNQSSVQAVGSSS